VAAAGKTEGAVGERLIFDDSASWRRYVGDLALAALLTLVGLGGSGVNGVGGAGLFVLGLVLAVRAIVKRLGTRYVLTEALVSHRFGLFAREISEIDLADVRNVQVRQSASDRLLGIGDVLVSSSGQSDCEVTLLGVIRPVGVAELVRHASAQRRSARVPSSRGRELDT
jgi:uncharacterized membrane protein YdbT with pleckstrin-like domain